MKTEINLSFNRKEIEQIFFENGDQKLLFGGTSKRQSVYLLIGLIAFPFFMQQASVYKSNVIMGIGIVLFGLVCYNYMRVAKRIIDWRRSVRLFLDENEKIQQHTLRYDGEGFELIQDDETFAYKWPEVKNAVITDRYIRLHAPTDALIPRSAMGNEQFEAFKAVVSEKVIRIN
jgi:hypothetical protein